jgi:hypothetical protein
VREHARLVAHHLADLRSAAMSTQSVAHVYPSLSVPLATVIGVAENLDTIATALRGLFELEGDRRAEAVATTRRLAGARPVAETVIGVLQQAVLEQLEREADRLEALCAGVEVAA